MCCDCSLDKRSDLKMILECPKRAEVVVAPITHRLKFFHSHL